MKTSKYSTPAWTPFIRDELPPLTDEFIRQQAKALNISFERCKEMHARITAEEEIFVNSLYQVNVRTIPKQGDVPEIKHLSIKRRDKRVIHDWRDLQRIKNELVGAECEGVEIYPAESRLIDTANQYHLWVFNDPEYRIGLGWHEGRLVHNTSKGGAVQRPIR